MSASSAPTLESVLSDLARLVRAEVARHPQGHLLGVPGSELELSLRVSLSAPGASGEAALASRADELLAEAREEIEALLLERSAFRPGHVVNLRTGEAGGKDTQPPDARFVFSGWSPSGVPRFLDFAQLLLERKHEEQHRLYHKPPALLTLTQDRDDLRRELLPAFADDADRVLRVHGQVVAGWFQVPRSDGGSAVQALTLQVVSVGAPGRSARRYALNVLGTGPEGEPLSEVVVRFDDASEQVPPWKHGVDWAQKALGTLNGSLQEGRRRQRKGGGKPKGRKRRPDDVRSKDEAKIETRIRGILGGMSRRLEQRHRSRRRRTDHAQERHRDGDRPTRMAMQDLARAGAEEVLVDQRRDTLVVLGERGRAHVFNDVGKLVTSIRYTPESIERKRRQDIWRPASRDEIQHLRKTVGV